jgi:copper chaperone CopZ
MNSILKISVVLCLVVFSKLSYSQDFSSIEKITENLTKVEVIFKEVKDVKTAELIISTLKEIDGVKDVELFYPSRNNAYFIISPKVTAKEIIEKLSSISVELDPKSLKK